VTETVTPVKYGELTPLRQRGGARGIPSPLPSDIESQLSTRCRHGVCCSYGACGNLEPDRYKDFAPTEQVLHPDDLVAAIDINHLAGDGGGPITR